MENDLTKSKANTLKGLLQTAKQEIIAALPKHVTPDRMMRIALTEARKNPKLLECDPASFLGAVIQASQLGLEPGGALGHCYLIPYGKEVNFQVGYRGMISLAMRSINVSRVSCRAVHEGDHFVFEYGLNEDCKHVPSTSPGKLTHVYAVIHLKDGSKMFDVMDIKEVEAVKKSSKTSGNGPWVTHYEEMAKKSVIRRLFKLSPVSIEIQTAVGLDELADAGKSQGNGAIIETTGKEVKSKADDLNERLGVDVMGLEDDDKDNEDPNMFGGFKGSSVTAPVDPRIVK